MKMTVQQQNIHEEALHLVKARKMNDSALIDNFMRNQNEKLYACFGKPDLYLYIVEVLELSEPVAATFKTVARKAMEVPELCQAIRENRLSVCKASRIVSVIDKSNAEELVQFASQNSWRAIEVEMARRRPSTAGREKIKPINPELVEVKLYVTPEQAADLRKAQDLLSSKNRKAVSLSGASAQAWKELVQRHDPVKKAERAHQRKAKKAVMENSVVPTAGQKVCAHRENKSILRKSNKTKRIRLTAEEQHTVNLRDEGRCTFVDEHGHRCKNERWIETHHMVKVSEGGTNDPSNLTSLCWSHHDLVHQLSLPLEGQVSWLRSRSRPYGMNVDRPALTSAALRSRLRFQS